MTRKAKIGVSRSISYIELIGLEIKDPVALAAKIASGLPYSALEKLRQKTEMSLAKLTDWVQINQRTLARRRAVGKLEPDESDRLVRATMIFSLATDLFEGDRAAALRWLLTPKVALGNKPPIELAKTEVGAREVEALIGRLEYGVYS